jgi:hypothetical protein
MTEREMEAWFSAAPLVGRAGGGRGQQGGGGSKRSARECSAEHRDKDKEQMTKTKDGRVLRGATESEESRGARRAEGAPRRPCGRAAQLPLAFAATWLALMVQVETFGGPH